MTCNDIAEVLPLCLSGELDAERAGAFAEHLRGCHSCAERVAQTKKLDDALRGSVLSEPVDSAVVDQRIRARLAGARTASLRVRWLIAAAAAFFIGLMGVGVMFTNRPPRMCLDAAKDYRSEITLGHKRKWLTDAQAVAGLAERIGIPGSLVTTLTPNHYSLKQGKLCRLDGQVFLHLVYAQGERQVSVYLRPAAHSSAPAVHETETAGEHVAYFEARQANVLFVTDQPGNVAASLARSAARAL